MGREPKTQIKRLGRINEQKRRKTNKNEKGASVAAAEEQKKNTHTKQNKIISV